MKNFSFLIFFGIILTIHFLVNYYIYYRGIQALQGAPNLKPLFRWVMLVLVLAYPVGRILERVWYSPFSSTIHWIGAFWFAGMLYVVLLTFTTDIIRLLNALFHFLPAKDSESFIGLKLYTGYGIAGATLLIVLVGFLNAWHPKINKRQITIDKPAGNLKELKIVAASDIHLGTIIGPRKTRKLVQTINGLKPDIILFAGDVVDEDVGPVIRQNLGECLRQLKAPMGKYTITGNHEFIGGAERSVKYLEEHGLTVLRDSVVKIDNAFFLAGREDKDKMRFSGSARKTVSELLKGIDGELPVILLDHQPFELERAEQAGIDLQISGHTHHGQLWPFGYLTERIFEVSRGYKQKGRTHFIVSTGFGTWGPPVRTGNRPEILEITLLFEP